MTQFPCLPVASQAERDHFRYLRTQTRLRVQRSCAGEMEREVHAVLGPVGVDEKLSRQVADSLLALEDEQALEEYRHREANPSIRTESSSESWLSKIGLKSGGVSKGDDESGLRWSEDVGLTAFLLKFGEGMGTWFFLAVIACVLTVNRWPVILQKKSLHYGCISPRLRSGWGKSFFRRASR